jgi:hypothetical protein
MNWNLFMLVFKVWVTYETCRSVVVALIRREIAHVAGSKITCRRCRWRLFCTRTAFWMHPHLTRFGLPIKIKAIGFIIALGNWDSIKLVLQKLLEERKAVILARRHKKETAVS